MSNRVHPIFPSFTTGELSPLMYGRVDFAKYASGLRQLLNFIIRPHGPVTRRAGTHFIAEVKDSTKFTRMLKFEYSVVQAYQIEAGHLYFRFYKAGGRIEVPVTGAVNNGGGLVRITSAAHGLVDQQQVTIYGVTGTTEANGTRLINLIDANTFDLQGSAFVNAYVSGGSAIPEVVTPYTSNDLASLSDLPALKYAQNSDTIYFAHPLYTPQKLVRSSHTGWTLTAVNFLPPPTYESGFTSGGNITFGATSGLAVNITLGSADLLASDVGKLITIPGTKGRAIIKTFVSTTTGTVDIVDTLTTTVYAAGLWVMQGSPVTNCTPSVSQPAHMSTTLTLAAAGWRATDVGRVVRINHGTVRITAFTSTTVAVGEILSVLTNVTVSPGGAWSIEDPQWSAARGYPRAIALHEQRLLFAGNLARPNSIWGSNTGQFEVFGLSPDDDDAYEFIMATNDVNTINWLLPSRALLAGTASAEFSIQGSPGAANAAITPNNIDIKASTFWGSSETISPLRIGNAGLFITRPGTEFREMVFSLQRDSYVADDMLLLAEHLTKGIGATITDIAYQRHPNSTVWCIRSDGALLSLAYQREHDVVGWARNITGPDGQMTTPVKGKFESVVVTPHWNKDRDVAFYTVKRTINGATKRYVEYMDDVNGFYGPLGMDCALTYDGTQNLALTLTAIAGAGITASVASPTFVPGDVGSEIVAGNGKARITGYNSAQSVTVDTTRPAVGGQCPAGSPFASTSIAAGGWGLARFSLSGLTHLIGETVTILGDGAVYPTQTVSGGGACVIDGLSVVKAEIGLGFTSVLETMRVEVPQGGTSQGVQKHWAKIFARVNKTLGMTLNGDQKPFRSAANNMDQAIPLFTGDYDGSATPGDRDGIINIQQTQPLPLTVVAIFGTLSVGD